MYEEVARERNKEKIKMQQKGTRNRKETRLCRNKGKKNNHRRRKGTEQEEAVWTCDKDGVRTSPGLSVQESIRGSRGKDSGRGGWKKLKRISNCYEFMGGRKLRRVATSLDKAKVLLELRCCIKITFKYFKSIFVRKCIILCVEECSQTFSERLEMYKLYISQLLNKLNYKYRVLHNLT